MVRNYKGRWFKRAKTLADKPDDISSMSRAHIVEAENQILKVVL